MSPLRTGARGAAAGIAAALDDGCVDAAGGDGGVCGELRVSFCVRLLAGLQVLDDGDFVALVVVADFVAETAHEEDAASVLTQDVFRERRVGNAARFEAGAFVVDDRDNGVAPLKR